MKPYPVRLVEVAQGYGMFKVVLILQSPKVLEQLVETGFQQPFVDASDLGREPEALRFRYGLNFLVIALGIDGGIMASRY